MKKKRHVRHPSFWVLDKFGKAAEMDVNRLAAARMRVRYLLEAIEDYEKDFSGVGDVWIEQAFDEIFYLLKAATTTTIYKDDITDSMIESARNYPIEHVVDFNRNGKALAWCHNDTHPSLTLWKKANRCRCFSCSKTFDPISVLMDRDSMSFVEAVKTLS